MLLIVVPICVILEQQSSSFFSSSTDAFPLLSSSRLYSFWLPAYHRYIRHHHPVPQVDPDAYRLVVDATAGGGRKLELTLADLASLPQHEVVATMQCSGNRRKDMSSVAPTSGTSWYQGAISTASFRGPAVRELLALAGFNPHSIGVDKNNQSSADAAAAKATAESVKHCCFKGLDGMAASIILNKALNPYGDTILALTMNGEPLPRDHG